MRWCGFAVGGIVHFANGYFMAMRCAIYLLNVPEFEPLKRGLSTADGMSLTQRGDYWVAESDREIVLHRRDVGVGQAVWFGALTGGVTGKITEFSEDTLRIATVD
jgi:hypothetical protein